MYGSTFTVSLIGATATLILATACGSTTASPPLKVTTSGVASATTAPTVGVLSVAKTSLGPVLVDRFGRTVYLLTADTPGHSSCAGPCLRVWPPVAAPAGKTVPSVPGVGARLAVTKSKSGARMVTAAGWPLYGFAKDKAPGDVNGQGKKSFGGTWYAVSPAGKAIHAKAAKAPATGPTNGVTPGAGAANGY